MHFNVKERGEHVSTFRWIDVRLMEILAAWVPTTPEMEAKLVFGAHIWDVAQHADSFGKRTHELRLPLQHSLAPTAEYARLLDEVAAVKETNRRVAGFYDCVLPGFERKLRDYLERVDPLLDGPTVRIIERVLFDTARMSQESRTLREEIAATRLDDTAWLESLKQREACLGSVVAQQPAASAAVA